MPPLLRLLSGLALALAASAAPVHAAHPHYERLLREGTFALERGDAAEAVHDLRLACFGMLEEPEALADCLTRLALGQAAAGDAEGFRETFRRLTEVEERFEAWSGAEIPAVRRSALEAEVAARIPARILAESPGFVHLAPPPEGPEEGAAPPSPRAVQPEIEGDGARLTAEDAARLARARELLAAAASRQDLDEPSRLARRVADANPGSREAQHLAAVIAYRAARWQEAVTYFRRGGDPGDGSPEILFYLAVSLYEAGEREAAAEVLRRSLPRIENTPFVQSYREKILDDGGSGAPVPPAEGKPRGG